MPGEMFCRYANDEGNMCSDKVGNLSILNWYIIDNVSIHSESIHRQFENSARQYWLANSANVAAGWRRAGLGLVRSSLYFLNAINKCALHSCLFVNRCANNELLSSSDSTVKLHILLKACVKACSKSWSESCLNACILRYFIILNVDLSLISRCVVLSQMSMQKDVNTDYHVNLSHYLSFFCILNDCSVTSASHDFSFFCF